MKPCRLKPAFSMIRTTLSEALRTLRSSAVMSLAVTTRMGMRAVSLWRWRASTTSNPFTSGIIRSSRIRSGSSRWARMIASLPPYARTMA